MKIQIINDKGPSVEIGESQTKKIIDALKNVTLALTQIQSTTSSLEITPEQVTEINKGAARARNAMLDTVAKGLGVNLEK